MYKEKWISGFKGVRTETSAVEELEMTYYP